MQRGFEISKTLILKYLTPKVERKYYSSIRMKVPSNSAFTIQSSYLMLHLTTAKRLCSLIAQ